MKRVPPTTENARDTKVLVFRWLQWLPILYNVLLFAVFAPVLNEYTGKSIGGNEFPVYGADRWGSIWMWWDFFELAQLSIIVVMLCSAFVKNVWLRFFAILSSLVVFFDMGTYLHYFNAA